MEQRKPRTNNGERKPRRNGQRRAPRREEKEFEERVVTINRVTKVVKGGRRMRFAALVVIGDRKGRVGFGTGKANEVPDAIRKACENAKRNVIKVPSVHGTIPHEVNGVYGSGNVFIKPASQGTGIVWRSRKIPITWNPSGADPYGTMHWTALPLSVITGLGKPDS